MSKKTLLNVATFGLAGAVLKDDKKKNKAATQATSSTSSSTASTSESESTSTGRRALIASATSQGDLGNALLGSNRLLGN